MAFEHRKLKVYDRSLDLIVEIIKACREVAPGWSELLDQIKRAATSIVLNIAEGAGEFSPKEKARFYRMSVRSTAEVSAAFDVLERVGALKAGRTTNIQNELHEVASMVTGLCKTAESRIPKKRR